MSAASSGGGGAGKGGHNAALADSEDILNHLRKRWVRSAESRKQRRIQKSKGTKRGSR